MPMQRYKPEQIVTVLSPHSQFKIVEATFC